MRPTWTTWREGNVGIIIEEHFNILGQRTDRFEWHVSANVVPAFIEARRRIVDMVTETEASRKEQ